MITIYYSDSLMVTIYYSELIEAPKVVLIIRNLCAMYFATHCVPSTSVWQLDRIADAHAMVLYDRAHSLPNQRAEPAAGCWYGLSITPS